MPVDSLKLIQPTIEYRDSFVAALEEGLNEKLASPDKIDFIRNNFALWWQQENDLNRPVTLPDGRKVPRIPDNEFWLVNNKEFVGRVTIRHYLTPELEMEGGHIGYAISASQRRKGYGTLILQMAIPHARRLGIKPALITCDDNNIGSIKVIENNGGILKDKVYTSHGARLTRRYLV
jgi:predicted acetyltransferase